MKQSVKGFFYVTGWICAWALFSSIINAGFIAINLYTGDGKSAMLTFLICGAISIAGALSLYKEAFANNQKL